MKITQFLKLNQNIRAIFILFSHALVLTWLILFFINDGLVFIKESSFLYLLVLFLSIILMISSTILIQIKALFGSLFAIAVITSINLIDILNHSSFKNHFITDIYFVIALCLMLTYVIEFHFLTNHKLNEMKQEYTALERYYNITKSMMEITPKMLLNDNLDQLLQEILEKAIELMPQAQSGSVLIKNDNEMEFRACVGYDLNILKKIKLRFEDTYQYRLNLLYEPSVIKDIKTFNEANPKRNIAEEFKSVNTEMAKAVLTCAIKLNDEVYGFINLDNMDNEEAFQDEDKALIQHLAAQVEIALSNHQLVEEIYQLSQLDALTGTNNRKYYEKLVHQLIGQNNVKFCLVMLDINNLKYINDTYGHLVGDQCLIYFTKLISMNIKPTDKVSRTGGDEFIIILPNTDLEQTKNQIETIKQTSIDFPFQANDKNIEFGFAYGIACYPSEGDNIEKIIELADTRMYEDKRKQKVILL